MAIRGFSGPRSGVGLSPRISWNTFCKTSIRRFGSDLRLRTFLAAQTGWETRDKAFAAALYLIPAPFLTILNATSSPVCCACPRFDRNSGTFTVNVPPAEATTTGSRYWPRHVR